MKSLFKPKINSPKGKLFKQKIGDQIQQFGGRGRVQHTELSISERTALDNSQNVASAASNNKIKEGIQSQRKIDKFMSEAYKNKKIRDSTPEKSRSKFE